MKTIFYIEVMKTKEIFWTDMPLEKNPMSMSHTSAHLLILILEVRRGLFDFDASVLDMRQQLLQQ